MDFSLNDNQVAQIRDKFEACARAEGVISVVFQPTGLPNMTGLTRGCVRVLFERNYRTAPNRTTRLVESIKQSVDGIFQSASIALMPHPGSFEKSVSRDAKVFDKVKAREESHKFGYRLGREICSGQAVRFDYIS